MLSVRRCSQVTRIGSSAEVYLASLLTSWGRAVGPKVLTYVAIELLDPVSEACVCLITRLVPDDAMSSPHGTFRSRVSTANHLVPCGSPTAYI